MRQKTLPPAPRRGPGTDRPSLLRRVKCVSPPPSPARGRHGAAASGRPATAAAVAVAVVAAAALVGGLHGRGGRGSGLGFHLGFDGEGPSGCSSRPADRKAAARGDGQRVGALARPTPAPAAAASAVPAPRESATHGVSTAGAPPAPNGGGAGAPPHAGGQRGGAEVFRGDDDDDDDDFSTGAALWTVRAPAEASPASCGPASGLLRRPPSVDDVLATRVSFLEPFEPCFYGQQLPRRIFFRVNELPLEACSAHRVTAAYSIRRGRVAVVAADYDLRKLAGTAADLLLLTVLSTIEMGAGRGGGAAGGSGAAGGGGGGGDFAGGSGAGGGGEGLVSSIGATVAAREAAVGFASAPKTVAAGAGASMETDCDAWSWGGAHVEDVLLWFAPLPLHDGATDQILRRLELAWEKTMAAARVALGVGGGGSAGAATPWCFVGAAPPPTHEARDARGAAAYAWLQRALWKKGACGVLYYFQLLMRATSQPLIDPAEAGMPLEAAHLPPPQEDSAQLTAAPETAAPPTAAPPPAATAAAAAMAAPPTAATAPPTAAPPTAAMAPATAVPATAAPATTAAPPPAAPATTAAPPPAAAATTFAPPPAAPAGVSHSLQLLRWRSEILAWRRQLENYDEILSSASWGATKIVFRFLNAGTLRCARMFTHMLQRTVGLRMDSQTHYERNAYRTTVQFGGVPPALEAARQAAAFILLDLVFRWRNLVRAGTWLRQPQWETLWARLRALLPAAGLPCRRRPPERAPSVAASGWVAGGADRAASPAHADSWLRTLGKHLWRQHSLVLPPTSESDPKPQSAPKPQPAAPKPQPTLLHNFLNRDASKHGTSRGDPSNRGANEVGDGKCSANDREASDGDARDGNARDGGAREGDARESDARESDARFCEARQCDANRGDGAPLPPPPPRASPLDFAALETALNIAWQTTLVACMDTERLEQQAGPQSPKAAPNRTFGSRKRASGLTRQGGQPPQTLPPRALRAGPGTGPETAHFRVPAPLPSRLPPLPAGAKRRGSDVQRSLAPPPAAKVARQAFEGGRHGGRFVPPEVLAPPQPPPRPSGCVPGAAVAAPAAVGTGGPAGAVRWRVQVPRWRGGDYLPDYWLPARQATGAFCRPPVLPSR